MVIAMEIAGIAGMAWLNKGAANKDMETDYQRYMANQEAVITELNRIELAKQEDLKPMEALSSMLLVMPEQVKCRHITIGNFHNGDWIVMELEAGEPDILEKYLSSLRKNQYFTGMRIADINDGVKVTVPMPEGFLWQ